MDQFWVTSGIARLTYVQKGAKAVFFPYNLIFSSGFGLKSGLCPFGTFFAFRGPRQGR